MDRYVARKAVLADLAALGLLVSEKPHRMIVPRCGRTGEMVEPMLTDQWFVAMRRPGRRPIRISPVTRSRSSVSPRSTTVVDCRPRPGSAACGSCRRNGSRPIFTGSTTCRTGAFRGSSGGATGSPRGTTRMAMSTSRGARPPRASRRGEARPPARVVDAGSGRARHLVLVGPVVPLDARLARGHLRAAHVPAVVGARHRLRHHLLLGRADGHDDDLLHRQGAVPRRLHQRPRARRGRPEDVEVEGQRPRSARPDRRRGAGGAGREAHLEHDGSAAGGIDREANAKQFPDGIPHSAPTRCASRSRASRPTAAR